MNYDQKQVLLAELNKVAYTVDLAARNYQAIANLLNDRESVANPIPQPTRPKFIAWDTFMDLLEPADVLVMYAQGNLPVDLRAALDANDRTITLAIWRGLKTIMTVGSVSAVQTEADATELDPTWSATVLQPSIAQGLALPTVSARNVQSAHHRLGG